MAGDRGPSRVLRRGVTTIKASRTTVLAAIDRLGLALEGTA
jgi:hypothetical protein